VGFQFTLDSYKSPKAKSGISLKVEADVPIYGNNADGAEEDFKGIIEIAKGQSSIDDGTGGQSVVDTVKTTKWSKFSVNGRGEFKFNMQGTMNKITYGLSVGVEARLLFDATLGDYVYVQKNSETGEIQTTSGTNGGDLEARLVLTPSFGIGVRYEFLQDRFAMNVGLSTSLFEIDSKIVGPKSTAMAMPDPTFGAGVRFNFTKNVIAETMLSSGIKAKSQGFIFLITARK
jgi:hypothetical protein